MCVALDKVRNLPKYNNVFTVKKKKETGNESISAKWVAHIRTHVEYCTESMPEKCVANGCTLVRFFFFWINLD